jgi:hypothetical protein
VRQNLHHQKFILIHTPAVVSCHSKEAALGSRFRHGHNSGY